MKTLRTVFLIALAALALGCQDDWLDYSPIDMYSAKVGYDDSKATRHLSVAAVSIEPSKTDKAQSLQTMAAMVQKIKAEHADIQAIVFGELCLGWYYDPDAKAAYQQQIAETVPGASTASVAALAAAHNVTIVFGMTEVDTQTQKYYNTQVLLRPNGELLKYRKRNLNETDTDNGLTAGNEQVVTTIDGVRVAMFVCSDMQSDKLTKEMADAKVDVVLQSLTSTTDLNPDVSYVGTQLNTWIVFANRYGTEGDFEYTGFTQIINPVGTVSERNEGKNVYVYRKLGILNK